MKRRMLRLFVMVSVFFSVADVAQAGFLPGGFEFGFFTDALRALFTVPFRILGCVAG